jgi:hypothetical protein
MALRLQRQAENQFQTGRGGKGQHFLRFTLKTWNMQQRPLDMHKPEENEIR